MTLKKVEEQGNETYSSLSLFTRHIFDQLQHLQVSQKLLLGGILMV